MFDSRPFWLFSELLVLLVYLAAIIVGLSQGVGHWLPILALIFLFAHLIEIPLAYMLLRERDPSLLRLLIMTFIFGLIWWVPARRGLFRIR